MPKPPHHTLDIYEVDLHLAWTPKMWDRILTDTGIPSGLLEGGPGSGARATTSFCNPDDHPHEPHLVFWFSEQHLRADSVQVMIDIAHEATHGAAMVLDHVGQEYDGESEALAYLVGWLTGWVVRNLPWVGDS